MCAVRTSFVFGVTVLRVRSIGVGAFIVIVGIFLGLLSTFEPQIPAMAMITTE